jgi:hypothetical protein
MFKRKYTASGSQTNPNTHVTESFLTDITIQGDFNGQIFNVNENGEVPIAVNMSVLSDYSQYSGELICNTCQVQGFNITSHTIVGLSLETLESYLYERNPTAEWQKYPGSLIGFDITNKGVTREGEARSTRMGGNANTSGDLPITADMVHPYDCTYTNLYTGEHGYGAVSDGLTARGSLAGNNQPVFGIRNQIWGDWARTVDTTITVGIPIFDTDYNLKQYIQSGGEIVEGLLNGEQPVKPENYQYFMQNEYTEFENYGLSSQTGRSWFYNLRFEMNNPETDRLCLVNTQWSDDHSKRYRLYGVQPYMTYANTSDGWKEFSGDPFEAVFVRTEGLYGAKKYDIPRLWYTNLYFFDGPDSEEWARHYIETGDPTGATNLKEVARANKQKIPGKIGDPTTITPNGTPSFTMSSGGRIVGLTSGQANRFFSDIFQSGNVQDLLDGTQLFGANQIGAIRGFHYLPVDITEICTCGSTHDVFLGSYKYTFADSVQWVTNNNKMINCGSAAFPETYGDYRDYEPYCKLAVMLPYCGTHELKISNYINKTITIKYAVDVTTGACTAYIFADGIIIDSFDGSMQVNRPVTANDQQRQASSVFDGLMKTGVSAVGTVGQVAGGVSGGAAIGGATGNLTAQTAGSIAGGMISGGGGALSTIGQAANTLQMAIDNPISTRGSYGGILGLFGVQSPYFIFGWLRTVEPNNELSVVGKPSGTGQAVGAFGGFLQTSAFQLASCFTGTDNEAEEIYNIVSSGIYL